MLGEIAEVLELSPDQAAALAEMDRAAQDLEQDLAAEGGIESDEGEGAAGDSEEDADDDGDAEEGDVAAIMEDLHLVDIGPVGAAAFVIKDELNQDSFARSGGHCEGC